MSKSAIIIPRRLTREQAYNLVMEAVDAVIDPDRGLSIADSEKLLGQIAGDCEIRREAVGDEMAARDE